MRTRLGWPFAVVLALLAWTGAPTAMASDTPTVLKRAISTLPGTIDPQKQNQAVQRQLLNDLFIGLTELDQTGQVSPGAAQDWQVSDDGLTYTFRLRPGGKWQDGHPVTAQDFVLGLGRLFALGNDARQANLFASIRNSQTLDPGMLPVTLDTLVAKDFGVRAVDDLTLEITLSRPFPYFLFVLSKPPAFPVPSHVYAVHGEAWVSPDTLVGNGPYQLVEARQDEFARLRQSAYFHAPSATMPEEVVHLQPPETITMGRFMAAGKADISSAIPHYQMQAVRTLPGFRLAKVPDLSIATLLFNSTLPKLASADVRRALELAVDRTAMLENLNADFEPLTTLVPPIHGYLSPERAEPAREQAIREARTLMEAAGYGPERLLKLSLLSPDGLGERTIAAQIKRDWGRIYVDLGIEQLPFGQQVKRMGSGQFEVVRRNWVADYPDPYNFLQIYTHKFNMALFPEEDTLLAALFDQANAKLPARAEYLSKAEDHLMKRHIAVPLFVRTQHFLVSRRVSGWSNAPWAPNASRWLNVKQ